MPHVAYLEVTSIGLHKGLKGLLVRYSTSMAAALALNVGFLDSSEGGDQEEAKSTSHGVKPEWKRV